MVETETGSARLSSQYRAKRWHRQMGKPIYEGRRKKAKGEGRRAKGERRKAKGEKNPA
jgi:hypothetical protein